MPRSIAREPVRVDVGVPRCSGILVCSDKVRVYLAAETASFLIAPDDSLREALTVSFNVGGRGDELGGVDGGDESV